MNKARSVAILISSIFAFSFGSSADAQDTAIGNVNMRTGPGVGYSTIGTIPRGAPLRILGCQHNGWCDVVYGYNRGWASGRYLQRIQPPMHYGYPVVSLFGEPRTYRVLRRSPVLVVPTYQYGAIEVPYGYVRPISPYVPQIGAVGWP